MNENKVGNVEIGNDGVKIDLSMTIPYDSAKSMHDAVDMAMEARGLVLGMLETHCPNETES